MNDTQFKARPARSETATDVSRRRSGYPSIKRVLCVGTSVDLQSCTARTMPAATVTCAPFANLAEALSEDTPDMVVSHLVSGAFDCHDLAERLVQLEFTGKYRAISGDLPQPDLVRREICTSYPGLNFDLLLPCDTPPIRLC